MLRPDASKLLRRHKNKQEKLDSVTGRVIGPPGETSLNGPIGGADTCRSASQRSPGCQRGLAGSWGQLALNDASRGVLVGADRATSARWRGGCFVKISLRMVDFGPIESGEKGDLTGRGTVGPCSGASTCTFRQFKAPPAHFQIH